MLPMTAACTQACMHPPAPAQAVHDIRMMGRHDQLMMPPPTPLVYTIVCMDRDVAALWPRGHLVVRTAHGPCHPCAPERA